MLGDFPYRLMPMMIGFVENVLEVVVQLLCDILVFFQTISILIFENCDSIVYPVLNGGKLEEFCVSFSVFEPKNPTFLFL